MTTREKIIARAKEAGFDFCGFAPARNISPEGERYSALVAEEQYAGLGYLNRDPGRRTDPTKVLPSAKTVIALLLNYYQPLLPSDKFIISRYAYGKDYHEVLKSCMMNLVDFLKQECGSSESKAFVDSGPVLEKGWASHCGLGWQGKNTIMINKNQGSFFFIGIILTDLLIEPSVPETDHCGNCTRCIEACPMGALTPYHLDPTKCIAYLNIDLEIPPDKAEKFGGRIFGCDICQDACPFNHKAVPATHPDMQPGQKLASMNRESWINLTKEEFDGMFSISPVKRRGYDRFMNSIRILDI
ncbi:MAG: tRNA epoxyqueuosine(34) reductase QueG [Syntrophothermus sp.]